MGNQKIIYGPNTVPKAQQMGNRCYCYSSHLLLRAFSGIYWWFAVGEGCLLDFASSSRVEVSLGVFLPRHSLCFVSSADSAKN